MKGNYLILQNSDGKKWVLPKSNLKVALCLYQPSSKKGQLLKKCLPVIVRVPLLNKIVFRLIGVTSIEINHQASVDRLITSSLGEEKVVLSFFMGTPSSKHQKCTIQISRGNEIIAYCKVTCNEEIGKLFLKEEEILDYLKTVQIESVPSCLFAGRYEEGYYAFIQTTVKTCNSRVSHAIGDREISFLRNLVTKTSIDIEYEETDFYQDILWLKNNMELLEDNRLKTDCLKKILGELMQNRNGTVRYCISHGDFTPWNCFVEDDKLFAFDFEYAKRTYPPYIDLFHYYTQSAIFERHFNAEMILNTYEKDTTLRTKISDCVENDYTLYVMYLTSEIAKYTQRDSGKFSDDNLVCVKIWLDILLLISEKHLCD